MTGPASQTWYRRTCRIGRHPFTTSYEWARSCYDCAVIHPERVAKTPRTAAPLDIITAANCKDHAGACYPRRPDMFDAALIDLQVASHSWDPVTVCCPRGAIRVLDLLVLHELAPK